MHRQFCDEFAFRPYNFCINRVIYQINNVQNVNPTEPRMLLIREDSESKLN